MQLYFCVDSLLKHKYFLDLVLVELVKSFSFVAKMFNLHWACSISVHSLSALILMQENEQTLSKLSFLRIPNETKIQVLIR